MKRLLLTCLLTAFAASSLVAQEVVESDLENLKQAAQTFVDALNEGDADTIAGLFVEDGELVLSTGELLIGRENIAEHYANLFIEEGRPKVALETTSVRFIAAALASEDGTVHLTYPNGEISSHHFNSVHIKQEDGTWLYASVRDQEGDHALPSEKLLGLQWLIGDWMIQANGSNTWISFDWSQDGPYIDARATTETAGMRATAATLRIGWNARSETFNSWGFDEEGGFSHSSWNQAGPDHWILKTNGITSDGETNNATQTFALDPSGQSFIWSKRDQLIGGELQPEKTLHAVKRPPAPETAATTPQ